MQSSAFEIVESGELARRQRALDELVQRDLEVGNRAKSRVATMYGPTASSSLGTYDFSDSFARRDQIGHRSDWVHQKWLRPIRFYYRHMPKPIRMVIKKIFS